MTASPSPDERVSIGTVLDGRYRIDAVLGSGGMGRVYRGEHTGIGRAVAIKVLHADLGRNREAAARFQREALASGRLDHPNIVGVSDFGVLDDGACFLVMEALEGESLGERLQRDSRIPWQEALLVLRGVLAGLRHAHDRGVVHRDIKPDNVFLAVKEGELVVKILDFGIAKLVAGNTEDPLATRTGLTVGTPAYLSPEQAVGGEIKPASDIYSATIVLYEMLTGRAPFDDKDPLAMLGAHVGRPPPTLVEGRPELAAELPPGLEDMVQRGLQKTASERIPSASNYLAWIDAILNGMPSATGSAPVIAAPLLGTTTPAAGTAVPGSPTTPPPGTFLPVSLITPDPNDLSMILDATHATPVPGSRTPIPRSPATPVPGSLTTALDSLGPSPNTDGSLATVGANSMTMTPVPTRPSSPHTPVPGSLQTSPAIRAVSLAETPPVPLLWVKRGAIVLVVVVAIALVIALVTRRGSSDEVKPKRSDTDSKEPTKEPDDPSKPKPIPGAKPAQPKPPPKDPPKEVTVPSIKDETNLKALLYELQSGKDCAARKAVIPQLVELDDPAAIPALRTARYRMAGGFAGFGQDNLNACLTKDAEDAIKHLSRNQPPPPGRPRRSF